MRNEASFAPLLQSFFTGRLMQQKQASPHHNLLLQGHLPLAVEIPGEKTAETTIPSSVGRGRGSSNRCVS